MSMEHTLVTEPDTAQLAVKAAGFVADQIRSAIAAYGAFTCAVSGGRTPWLMLTELVKHDLPWSSVEIYQVDERVAPDGDPERNLTRLRQILGSLPVTLIPMPVTDPDLEAAAAAYASRLPARFDLVHLGLGADGHTASLVPGDPVLEMTDRLVAVTGLHRGHRRMTLTYPALARAEEAMWLVTGASKHDALARLLAGDRIHSRRPRAGPAVGDLRRPASRPRLPDVPGSHLRRRRRAGRLAALPRVASGAAGADGH